MTLSNIYSNNIKIRNDNYIIILFYFLDNMKKLTGAHYEKNKNTKYVPVELRYAVPVYQNPEFISFMFFENKLLIVREG